MAPKKKLHQGQNGTSTPTVGSHGTSTPVPKAAPEQTVVASNPPYVGINFGNTYASIAVCSKDGSTAECIANEDGERQIACAISFHGEEMYIGNQAKPQLVKNASNTIISFRNLLGKKFSEIPESAKTTTKSAPIIEHPSHPSEPAYRVQILQSAPKPLPTTLSAFTSPAASVAPTPRSEPTPVERVLTINEVTSLFLGSLIQSAEDFLGKKVLGAVISVPEWFDEEAKTALKRAAGEAGVKVLQLIDESGAASVTTTSKSWSVVGVGEEEATKKKVNRDRTQLLVDLGASSLSLTVLSIRDGLAHVLGSSTHKNLGGDQIDDKLIKFFAKEFTKKTKTALAVCPSTSPADKRAEAKLRLALEHTKRTLSASPGAATCSVESLKDGLDFTSSINRMRFDMEVRSIYDSVLSSVRLLLSSPNVDIDPILVNEIAYVGGSSCLPGLDETLVSGLFGDHDEEGDGVVTPFTAGTVVGGGTGDPTTVLARGCAFQAAMLAGLSTDSHEKGAFEEGKEMGAKVTGDTVGVLFANPKEGGELGGLWIPVVLKETPLPARRTIALNVGLNSETDAKFGFEIWEVKEGVRTEKRKAERVQLDDEDEEDEEEEEIKHKTVEKTACLGSVSLNAKLGLKDKKTAKVRTKVEVEFLVDGEGALEVNVRETGNGGAEANFKVNKA